MKNMKNDENGEGKIDTDAHTHKLSIGQINVFFYKLSVWRSCFFFSFECSYANGDGDISDDTPEW